MGEALTKAIIDLCIVLQERHLIMYYYVGIMERVCVEVETNKQKKKKKKKKKDINKFQN
jgi:hypothetical protein